jgi:hypothetical protein
LAGIEQWKAKSAREALIMNTQKPAGLFQHFPITARPKSETEAFNFLRAGGYAERHSGRTVAFGLANGRVTVYCFDLAIKPLEPIAAFYVHADGASIQEVGFGVQSCGRPS